MASLNIGLGQIRIIMGDKRANMASIFAMIGAAAQYGCDLLVLPECCLAGWLASNAAKAAEPIPGPFTRKLCSLAKHHRIAIVAGMEEKENGRVYNSAVFIDEAGKILLKHRKINELELAKSVYSTGSAIEVAMWRGRTLGLSICADSWRPEETDALWMMGARLILSPCAWAVEIGGESTNRAWIHETYRQRIADRDLVIVAANSVGTLTESPWKGRVLQGNSLAIGKGGMVLAQGTTSEPQLICCECP